MSGDLHGFTRPTFDSTDCGHAAWQDGCPSRRCMAAGVVSSEDFALALRVLAPGDDDNVTLGEIRAEIRGAAVPSLVGFLLARLNDDEAGLISGWRDHFRGCEALGPDGYLYTADCDCDGPGRQRREYEAKRAILASLDATQSPEMPSEAWVIGKEILAHLASVYAEHPDYRDEWKL